MSRAAAPPVRRASGPNCETAACCALASASPVCCAWLADTAVTDAKDRRHLAVRLALPSLPISYDAISPLPLRIAYGSPTSPLSRPGQASALWRWCLTSTAAVLSGGRWRTICAANWSSKLWIWRSGDGDQRRVSSLTPTREANTAVWPSGDGCAKPDLSGRWEVGAIASIMRPLRVSSRPWNASCWLVTASPHGAPLALRFSMTSRGSPTPTGDIQRWGLCPPPPTRGGGPLNPLSPNVLLSTKPG